MLGLRISVTPPPPNSPETVDSLLAANERAENKTAKDEAGENQYSSKIFYVYKKGGEEPKKVIKLTYSEQHEHTWRKTVAETRVYQKLKEAKSWKQHVMPFLEGGETPSFSYIMFEYLPGSDLVEYLNRRNSALKRQTIFTDILDNLIFLAKQGYIHGDMKADNVWITPSGQVRLFDLADAKRDPSPGQLRRELYAVNQLQDLLTSGRSRSRSRNRATKEPETLEDLIEEYRGLARGLRGGGRKTRRSK